eukprot:468780-Alexandrium_andersonii.AAC.1
MGELDVISNAQVSNVDNKYGQFDWSGIMFLICGLGLITFMAGFGVRWWLRGRCSPRRRAALTEPLIAYPAPRSTNRKPTDQECSNTGARNVKVQGP